MPTLKDGGTNVKVQKIFILKNNMKNIHLLPTDKPSRLFKILQFNFVFDNQNKYSEEYKKLHKYINQNIYITSDEEIKDGDWMIRGNEQPTLVTPNFFWDFGVRYYKIILTTDQDLIKDGVQAIDDEFLEFIVKNPSCESIEVESGLFFYAEGEDRRYKIIIPKEEPKQETIEETALNIIPDRSTAGWIDSFGATERIGFIKGVNYQAERMYSEEEVLNILQEFKRYLAFGDEVTHSDWFAQFKKK
jgi:hypothetical protein